MRFKMLTAILLSVLMIGCSQPENGTGQQTGTTDNGHEVTAKSAEQGMALVTADMIRKGTAYLSDDALEGRGTGTEGERKAAEWIAGQYQEIGLKSFGDNFYQEVSLVGFKKDAEQSSATLKGPNGPIPYENETTLTFWSSSQKPEVSLKDAEFVFVGYGVEAPEYQWDDFKGFDCKGKILIFLNDDPQVEEDGKELFGGETRTYYGRYTYKYEMAMAKGAAGAVVIHTDISAGYGWQVIGDNGVEESFALDLEGAGFQLDFLAWMHQDLADTMAQTVGNTLEQWFEMGKSRDFKPITLPVVLDSEMAVEIRKAKGLNVVGYVEGSDPKLKDEFIVFSAHYDHLGKKDSGEGDLIYNGAWDNALGTTCIVELARAYVGSNIKPKRSIAFLACTAEEKGLLGSQWFANQPPVPTKDFIANINVDMPQIFAPTKDIVAIGRDTNELGAIFKQTAAEFGYIDDQGNQQPIEVLGDQSPRAGSFYRSDQLHFAKAGVPALFIGPGKQYINEPKVDPIQYKKDHYHQASDEIDDVWDFNATERDIRVIFLMGLKVANRAAIPRWTPGNEFELAWKNNHPDLAD